MQSLKTVQTRLYNPNDCVTRETSEFKGCFSLLATAVVTNEDALVTISSSRPPPDPPPVITSLAVVELS